ncbi:MAG: hypothetical protein HLUCCA12_07375 [Rhodobacteraceae bacterium HLUCCA12]|nr:MAG: hypothetical protein HLUCCA12_07375 [Rhodobacteraceae bacterium HLUCCA12]
MHATRSQARTALRAIRRHPVLAAAMALALVLVAVFGLRIAMMLAYWPGQGADTASLKGWMPVGYVAHRWDVPREALAAALGIEPATARRRSLARIAAEQGIPADELIARLSIVIEEWHAEHDTVIDGAGDE